MSQHSRPNERRVSRLAPSPTGAQHLGNARTFIIAWHQSRSTGSELYLRIDDLDTPRIKSGAISQAIDDLHWLGIEWDSPPSDRFQSRESIASSNYWIQSQREERYAQILSHFRDREWIYPCTCSRSDIEEVASAPHESTSDAAIYPGTCSNRSAKDADALLGQNKPFSWRYRLASSAIEWEDEFYGSQSLGDPHRALGDFVVARSNGVIAYQLAVVIDDHDMQVTNVVRGSDLIFSTYRQIALLRSLQWNVPQYLHVPLVVGVDGRRLAKRHGDTRLSTFRNEGVRSAEIIGYLAWQSGWIANYETITIHDLLSIDILNRCSHEPLVVSTDELLRTIRS